MYLFNEFFPSLPPEVPSKCSASAADQGGAGVLSRTRLSLSHIHSFSKNALPCLLEFVVCGRSQQLIGKSFGAAFLCTLDWNFSSIASGQCFLSLFAPHGGPFPVGASLCFWWPDFKQVSYQRVAVESTCALVQRAVLQVPHLVTGMWSDAL